MTLTLRIKALAVVVTASAVGAAMLLTAVPLVPAAHAQSGAQVVIAEIFYNPDGSAEGHEFVKVVNAGDTAVDVSGWAFDDGISYTFPAGTELGSFDSYVIAASRTDFAAAFGADPDGVFQSSLSNKGETLRLVDQTQVIVDEVTYDDIAPWPRTPDGDGDSLQLADLDADNADPHWWVAGPPSPLGANAPHLGVVFDITRGFYSGDQTVTLTATDPTATIEYALDNGSLDLTYTGPITVADNDDIAVIRARAVKGAQASDITSHTYVFLPDTGAAVAAVWDNGKATADTDAETGHLEIVMPPSVGLDSIAEHAGFSTSSGGVSAESTKVYFRGAYGAGTLRADLFSDFYFGAAPTKQFDQLVFRDRHQDESLMRHSTAMDTLSAMGSLSPNGRYVRYYHDGVYKYARFLQERPEGGFMETYHGGTKADYASGNGKDDELVFATMPARGEEEYQPYLDSVVMEQYYDTAINTWFINNTDVAYNWRWALYQGADPALDDRLFFFTWDADVGYGDPGGRSPMIGWQSRHYASVGFRWYNSSALWFPYTLSRKTPAIYDMGDRFTCHLLTPGGALDPEAMLDRVDARYAQLVAAGGPEPHRLRPDAAGDWHTLMDTWIPGRAEWLVQDARKQNYIPETDVVTGSVIDGQMVLSGPPGWPIYYTLDGTDPRRGDTTPNPAAIRYNGPVPLPAGQSHVVARAYNVNEALDVDKWTPACLDRPLALSSAPAETASLVINEIHYNPATDGAEFVEVVNQGTESVSLAGMTLAGGITAELPAATLGAGEFVVVADSAGAFETAYGFAADATFGGELSNSGETVNLVGADGTTLDTVTYRDSTPWPNAADGTGPSLSVLDSAQARNANDAAASWGSSQDLGGSPGAANSITGLVTPTVTGLTQPGDADDATVAWSMADTIGVTGYRVTLIGPGAPDDPIEVSGGDTTSVIVRGLTARTGYCARVQAIGADSVSERSPWRCIDEAISTGDVNCDGAIDTDDVVSSLEVLVDLRYGMVGCPLEDPATEANTEAADLDRDGNADLADAWRQARCATSANAEDFCPPD